MNKRILTLTSLAFFTCATLASCPVSAASPTTSFESYDRKSVAKIEVKLENLPASSSFDPKPVLARLKTKTGDPFSQLIFDNDLKTLSQEYDRIEPSVEMTDGHIYITLRLWARPRISQIIWAGNEHISSKTLQKELGIKPKKILNLAEFNQALSKVKEYYIKKGYFESQISYNLIANTEDNTVEIKIDVHEGLSGIIEKIEFHNFTEKEQSHLFDMVYTKTYNLFTSWLTGAGTYNEDAIEQDKLTIVNYIQNLGYADAKVNIEVTPSKHSGKIILSITLDRGPIYHFGNISFKGNHLFSDAQIEKAFFVRPEEIYSPEKLRETAQAIRNLYGHKGYIETSVQYETFPVSSAPIYNVEFEIEEGEQYKIGLLKVFGNVQTQTHVILRESLLTPGEMFDSAKLKKTQERLQNMGYFKSVNVYAVRTQDDQEFGENYRDVYIEVEETTTGNLSLFFGFSSGDGLFGGVDLTETNFNYKGFGRLFKDGPSAMRGGGEYAHAKVTLGSKQRNYTISWLTPYFRHTLWRVGFDLFLNQSQLEAKKYEIDSLGGSIYASYPLNAYWSFGSKYRFKHAQIDVSNSASKKEKQAREGTGNVSAASFSMNFDSTDNMMKPHAGFRSIMEGEFSGLGGDFSFLKYSYLNTYYQQLWPRGILKYRFDFRFIQPTLWTKTANDIPLSERFFAGGENTVRGYKPYDLGDHYSNGDPTGGISYSVLSLEYLQEVFRLMDAFVFIDAGSVTLDRFKIYRYNMSWGVGLRLDLMNRVPITIGWGFPVNADYNDQIQRFFFLMGGQF